MELTKYEINSMALLYRGYKHIESYSRYMVKGGSIVNVIRMSTMRFRADGRISLIQDNGKRYPVTMSRIKWLSK